MPPVRSARSTILLTLVLTAGCGGARPRSEEPRAERPEAGETVTLDDEGGDPLAPPDGAPSRGAPDAELTIQVFSDFECPFCASVKPTLDRLLADYPGQLRIVWRHLPLPFHPHAALASEAAAEVHAQLGDEAFWRYHDLLFANQRALGAADLETYAKEIAGLDLARFRSALEDRRHGPTIRRDADALAAAGLPLATPTFLVGPLLLQGAQPYELFKEAVDGLLGAPSTAEPAASPPQLAD